jgi:hypothetical protein
MQSVQEIHNSLADSGSFSCSALLQKFTAHTNYNTPGPY